MKIVDSKQILIDRLTVGGKFESDAAILFVDTVEGIRSPAEFVEVRTIIAPAVRRFPIAWINSHRPAELKEIPQPKIVSSLSHP